MDHSRRMMMSAAEASAAAAGISKLTNQPASVLSLVSDPLSQNVTGLAEFSRSFSNCDHPRFCRSAAPVSARVGAEVDSRERFEPDTSAASLLDQRAPDARAPSRRLSTGTPGSPRREVDRRSAAPRRLPHAARAMASAGDSAGSTTTGPESASSVSSNRHRPPRFDLLLHAGHVTLSVV